MPAAVSLTLPLLSAAAWDMLARCGTVVYGTVSSNRVCTAAAYCAALASGTGGLVLLFICRNGKKG